MGLLNSGSTFKIIVDSIVSLINLTVGVLLALAVVVFFIGLVRYIRESGDAKGHAEAKERIMWSLIAIFILVSIWGILALMNTAFFGGGGSDNGVGNVPLYTMRLLVYPQSLLV
ncbi:MAG: hypothetical protein ABSE76_03565 [Minisyncoccia bacterium]